MKACVWTMIFTCMTASSMAFGQCGQWASGASFATPGVDASDMTVWDPDGSGPSQNVLVVGGFIQAVAPASYGVATWDGQSWMMLGGPFNNAVNAVCVHAGTVYCVGTFTECAGTTVRRVARWNGTVWEEVGGGTESTCYAVCSWAGDLLIGGVSGSPGGIPLSGIARWNGSEWSGMGAGLNISVRCFGVHNEELYAGGSFSTSGTAVLNKVARWDGTAWQPLGSGVTGSGQVLALESYQGALFVGGTFSSVNNQNLGSLARWSGGVWTAGPAAGGDVYDLQVHNDELCIAGFFGPRVTGTTGGFGRWNGSAYASFGSNNICSRGTKLAVFSDQLICAGDLYTTGTRPANRIAAWSAAYGWQPMGSGINIEPVSMTEHEGSLYIAGTNSAGTTRYTARLASHGWDLVGPPEVGGVALLSHAGNLYRAGGGASNTPNSIQKWTGSNWHTVGGGTSGSTVCLGSWNNLLIAGGGFQSAGSVVANRVARWDGVSWQAMGQGFTDGVVDHIAVHQNQLYVSGTFSQSGANYVWRVARWDGQAWQPLTPQVVFGGDIAIVSYGGKLVAANITQLDTTPFNKMVWWDGSMWTQMGTGLVGGSVSSVAVHNGDLVVAGSFQATGDTPLTGFARWSGSSWVPYATSTVQPVYSMTSYRGQLAVGGKFDSIGNQRPHNWGVFVSAPNALVLPPSVQLCPGGSHTFAVDWLGSTPATFVWRHDGTPVFDGFTPWGSMLSGAGTPELILTGIASDDSGAYDCVVTNVCGIDTTPAAVLSVPPACCDSIDFNNDEFFPDTADIDDFLSVFSGGACGSVQSPGCNDIDFNNDMFFPDTADIDAFLSVFSGGPCL